MVSSIDSTVRAQDDVLGFCRTMNPKPPRLEPIRQPTLFQMGKLEKAAELMGS